MNLEQLQYRTREIAGEGTSFDQVLEPELTELINEVYLEVSGINEWPWLRRQIDLDLVVGQDSYTDDDVTGSLPDRVELVFATGDYGRRLHPLREAERVEYQQNSNTTDLSTPTTYDLLHEYTDAEVVTRTFRVFPAPDKVETLVIRGTATPSVLALSTDTPVFDAQFHPVIAYLTAAYLMAQRSGEWRLSTGEQMEQNDWQVKLQSAEQRAGRILERMERFYLQQTDDGLVQMGGRRDSVRRRASRVF